MTPSKKEEFWLNMRVPVFSFIALLALLGLNVLLGVFVSFHYVWIIELLVMLVMVGVVLLFSMEVRHEPPLMRLFSFAGFCWVAIFFSITLIDYLTR